MSQAARADENKILLASSSQPSSPQREEPLEQPPEAEEALSKDLMPADADASVEPSDSTGRDSSSPKAAALSHSQSTPNLEGKLPSPSSVEDWLALHYQSPQHLPSLAAANAAPHSLSDLPPGLHTYTLYSGYAFCCSAASAHLEPSTSASPKQDACCCLPHSLFSPSLQRYYFPYMPYASYQHGSDAQQWTFDTALPSYTHYQPPVQNQQQHQQYFTSAYDYDRRSQPRGRFNTSSSDYATQRYNGNNGRSQQQQHQQQPWKRRSDNHYHSGGNAQRPPRTNGQSYVSASSAYSQKDRAQRPQPLFQSTYSVPSNYSMPPPNRYRTVTDPAQPTARSAHPKRHYAGGRSRQSSATAVAAVPATAKHASSDHINTTHAGSEFSDDVTSSELSLELGSTPSSGRSSIDVQPTIDEDLAPRTAEEETTLADAERTAVADTDSSGAERDAQLHSDSCENFLDFADFPSIAPISMVPAQRPAFSYAHVVAAPPQRPVAGAQSEPSTSRCPSPTPSETASEPQRMSYAAIVSSKQLQH